MIADASRASAGSSTLLALALFFCPNLAAAQADLRILPAYFTGEFGTGVRTDMVYVPVIFVGASSRQEFRLTLPYLWIRTIAPVTFTGGEIIRRGTGGATTVTGPGDVVVQDEYFFVQGNRRLPWISGIARLKLPTADESKGLGTGKADYGPGVSIIQPIGQRGNFIGAVEYVVRGEPAGAEFRNTLWVTAGFQSRLSDLSSVNLVYEKRQSVIGGRPDIEDLSLGLDHHLSPAVTFRSALYLGVSDTAEDYGFSLGLSFRGSPPRP